VESPPQFKEKRGTGVADEVEEKKRDVRCFRDALKKKFQRKRVAISGSARRKKGGKGENLVLYYVGRSLDLFTASVRRTGRGTGGSRNALKEKVKEKKKAGRVEHHRFELEEEKNASSITRRPENRKKDKSRGGGACASLTRGKGKKKRREGAFGSRRSARRGRNSSGKTTSGGEGKKKENYLEIGERLSRTRLSAERGYRSPQKEKKRGPAQRECLNGPSTREAGKGGRPELQTEDFGK